MKKYYFLIIVTLILGLVLTGCLLSNVGQVPTSEQSGITYLTKGPLSVDLVDLVGLWHFDENTGTTAFDSSGNPNDGTLEGLTSWTSGRFGNALSFDGVNDYVNVNDSISLSSIENGGTWELWIKPNSDLRTGKWIGFLDTAPSLVGAVQSIVDTSNRLRAGFGGVFGAMWSIDADWTGEWHHIAGTWNQKVNPTVTLYVDGVQKAQATPTVTVRVDLLDIGRLNNGNNFDGIIDEVRIWDGALTAEQIEDSANHGIVIQKGMSQDDAALGDHVTITLEVATAATVVTVVDTLPAELRYIPGTFMVDGVSATPTVVGQTISYTLTQPCAYTITFDAQVTSAEAVATLVTNYATAGDVSASAELTIHPYEGFEKEVEIEYEDTVDGVVEVGELVQWDMTITVPNNFAWPISNATLSDRLGGELGMAGDGVDNDLINGPDDGGFGDLLSNHNNIPGGAALDIKVRGKANKVQFKITGISISSGSAEFMLGIFTDKNPAGKQCYTSDGTYELNSGAVLKFIDPDPEGPGFQLSAHTPPITVEVTEP